jgi:hypothetical protein
MDLRERFARYADDFDLTVGDDDWSRIRTHFAENAVREEHVPPLISLHHEGIDQIISEWRAMVANFDRRFDRRILVRTGPVEQNGNVVTLPWVGIYLFRDTPALLGEGKEIARYSGERIQHLETTWTEDTIQRTIDWATRYGQRVPGLLEYTATLTSRQTANDPPAPR